MRFVARTILALALFGPALSFATSYDIANQGGTLSGSTAGLSVTGSTIVAISLNGGLPFTGNLGTISFSTGHLLSGTLGGGGVFADGAFNIGTNGLDGFPNGSLFSGAFTGPVTWVELTLANGTHEYTLTGTFSGTWYTGQKVVGATIQLALNTGVEAFNTRKSFQIASGDTNLTLVTPEPGSLSLIGTGLVGIGAVLRRKLRVA